MAISRDMNNSISVKTYPISLIFGPACSTCFRRSPCCPRAVRMCSYHVELRRRPDRFASKLIRRHCARAKKLQTPLLINLTGFLGRPRGRCIRFPTIPLRTNIQSSSPLMLDGLHGGDKLRGTEAARSPPGQKTGSTASETRPPATYSFDAAVNVLLQVVRRGRGPARVPLLPHLPFWPRRHREESALGMGQKHTA